MIWPWSWLNDLTLMILMEWFDRDDLDWMIWSWLHDLTLILIYLDCLNWFWFFVILIAWIDFDSVILTEWSELDFQQWSLNDLSLTFDDLRMIWPWWGFWWFDRDLRSFDELTWIFYDLDWMICFLFLILIEFDLNSWLKNKILPSAIDPEPDTQCITCELISSLSLVCRMHISQRWIFLLLSTNLLCKLVLALQWLESMWSIGSASEYQSLKGCNYYN